MLWIGITGPMGSGKSTVAHWLRQNGFEVLDADEVARKVLGPGTPGEAEVLKTFGQHLQDSQGRLDRRALGRAVFQDQAKLQRLEAIIHPLVRAEVARQREVLRRRGVGAAFYDVPLLFEKNMQTDFDYVIVVSAPAEIRRSRVMARSQLSVEEIEERNSKHIAPHIKEAKADVLIMNSGSLADLESEILAALRKLKIGLPSAAQT